MTLQTSRTLRDYIRVERLPTTWCPGCGLGIIMNCIVQAVDHRGLDKNEVAMISGIGCSGRMPVYVDFNTMHTTHGRALAFATGLHTLRWAQKSHLRAREAVLAAKFELEGQTLCVLGLGDIGGTLARKAQALGMRVLGVRRSRAPRPTRT